MGLDDVARQLRTSGRCRTRSSSCRVDLLAYFLLLTKTYFKRRLFLATESQLTYAANRNTMTNLNFLRIRPDFELALASAYNSVNRICGKTANFPHFPPQFCGCLSLLKYLCLFVYFYDFASMHKSVNVRQTTMGDGVARGQWTDVHNHLQRQRHHQLSHLNHLTAVVAAQTSARGIHVYFTVQRLLPVIV